MSADPKTLGECRQRLNEARLRLKSASEASKEALELSRELPLPDGSYAHQKALRAEILALAEYRSVLRIYTDLVLSGRIAEDATASRLPETASPGASRA